MSALAIAASLMLAPAPVLAVEQVDVAYDELASRDNAAAIRKIEGNDGLDRDHPARLINLGIAYARVGEVDEARALFRRALHTGNLELETATGDWIDSHDLARRAMAKLDDGSLVGQTRTAMR